MILPAICLLRFSRVLALLVLGSMLASGGNAQTQPATCVLTNTSVRTTLDGGQTLIVGGVVAGGTKSILVRAGGPALNAYGLAGLADPQLELYRTGSSPVAQNDDWEVSLAPIFAAAGAFPFASGSKDSALYSAVSGTFTAQAKGPGSGVVLVEVYDPAPAGTARLINLSARNRVGTGANILIAGFALSGSGTVQLLIRAVGPGLSQFGVTGVLENPQLEVFEAGSAAAIAANDDWPASLAPVFASVGAAAIATGSKDAAVVVTVQAGTSYTAQVSGSSGGTGEALIELYEIPRTAQPSAPVNITVAAGLGQATVSFSAPPVASISPINGYTVTATPVTGGAPVKVTGNASPITVVGLTNGTLYSIAVNVQTATGTGASSGTDTPVTVTPQIPLSAVLGSFQRNPVQNGYHTGTLSAKVPATSDNRLVWLNASGVSWELIPNLAQGYLAVVGGPYASTVGGDKFILRTFDGQISGFTFLGDTYAHSGTSQPLAQKDGGLGHAYIAVSAAAPPVNFGKGLSFYETIWQWAEKPYARIQFGHGTWITPENASFNQPLLEPGSPAAVAFPDRAGSYYRSVFQTIEGGPGVWSSTQFPSSTQKWKITGSIDGYRNILLQPGWMWKSNRNQSIDKLPFGVAQLSNRLLAPPDGFTFRTGTNGEVLGFAYMALPLTAAKTAGGVPVGDQSWTLFFNTKNFRGPVAFWVPESWAYLSKTYATVQGRGLDVRPGFIGSMALEFGQVPGFQARDGAGTPYVRIPKLTFPVSSDNRTYFMQDAVAYASSAFADSVQAWLAGGPVPTWRTDSASAYALRLQNPRLIFDQTSVTGTGDLPISNLSTYLTSAVFSSGTSTGFGIDWQGSPTPGVFPEYYRQSATATAAVAASAVPAETKLAAQNFDLATAAPYIAPTSATSDWTVPGKTSATYTALLSDGSKVTYAWFRFIDQPCFQNMGWSAQEKAALQASVEKIHATWTSEKSYLPPPSRGELVELDSALLVTPPPGLDLGYVPIVLSQTLP